MTIQAMILLAIAIGLLIQWCREHKWYDMALAMLALVSMVCSAFLPAISPY